MDVYEALYTTRAMRRVRPDPIPYPVQARILDAAIRAPSGGNTQGWRFILVDDPAVKDELGPLYRDSIRQLWATAYPERVERARSAPEDPANAATLRMVASAQHLADHFEEVPLFLIAFSRGDPSGGSIYPAVWSAQLAARAEGVGSALTSVLGIFPRPGGHGDPRRARRPRLDHGVLRFLRLPDRALGRGRAAPGAGDRLPQLLGSGPGPGGPRAALAGRARLTCRYRLAGG